MKVIPREAGRITYSTEIRNLKKEPFDDRQKAIIVGTVLGDGCLCANWSKTNSRLFINHSMAQKEYILWKYNVLRKWILTKPRFYPRNNSLTIRTISHPELTQLSAVFYRGNQKIIPENISKYIKNPLTLAVWFMDDGNAVIRKGKLVGLHINTQSFSLNENQTLLTMFENLYGTKGSVEKNNGKYRLGFYKKESREKLIKILSPFVIQSMKYKLG